jgi:hypothetical protein
VNLTDRSTPTLRAAEKSLFCNLQTFSNGQLKYFLTESSKQGRSLPMGQPGQSEELAPPPINKNLQKKKIAKFCNIVIAEFIELTVGTSRVLMSKAATNNISSNKHKA